MEKLIRLNEELRKVKIQISELLCEQNPTLQYPITVYSTGGSKMDNLINRKTELEKEIDVELKKII